MGRSSAIRDTGTPSRLYTMFLGHQDSEQASLTMCFRQHELYYHRPKATQGSTTWDKKLYNSKPKQTLCPLNKIPWDFCHSDRKVTYTVT